MLFGYEVINKDTKEMVKISKIEEAAYRFIRPLCSL